MEVVFDNKTVNKIDSDGDIHLSFYTDWNDYWKHMIYILHYKDIELSYRILPLKALEDGTLFFIDEDKYEDVNDLNNSQITSYFFGYGLHGEFYDNIRKLISNKSDFKKIMDQLHDITTGNKDFEKIVEFLPEELKLDYLKHGLFRDGSINYQLSKFLISIGTNFCDFMYDNKKIDNQYVYEDNNDVSKTFLDEFKNVLHSVDVKSWEESNEVVIDERSELVKLIIKGLDKPSYILEYLSSEDKRKLWELVEKDTDFVKDVAVIFGDIDGKIQKEVDFIQEQLRVSEIDKIPEELGQYTPLTTLEYIFPSKKKKDDQETVPAKYSSSSENRENDKEIVPALRLTNGNQLNDPMEGKVLFSLLGIDNKGDCYMDTRNYLASATVARDSLPMWNLYADNAKGVYTIFSKKYVENLLLGMNNTSRNRLYKICYIKTDDSGDFRVYVEDKENEDIEKSIKCLKKYIEEIKYENMDRILSYFDILKFLFKKSDYSYEREYRILRTNAQADEIEAVIKPGDKYILYTYLSLHDNEGDVIPLEYQEVIVGPKSIENVSYIAEYIKWIDNKVKVTCSKISYR